MVMDYNVKTENLAEGMVVKNYKEMCALLGEGEKDGNSKKAQIKNWNRFFSYEKQGQKFVIRDVYENPLPKPKRIGNNRNNTPNFLIPYEKENAKGVYKITLGKDIYIGTTNSGFREKYRCYNRTGDVGMSRVQNMIKNGAEFDVLQYMEDCTSKELRDRQYYFAEKYKAAGYNIVNIRGFSAGKL